jgi:hypothetical protein
LVNPEKTFVIKNQTGDAENLRQTSRQNNKKIKQNEQKN